MPKKGANYRFFFKSNIDGDICFEEETDDNILVPTIDGKIVIECRNEQRQNLFDTNKQSMINRKPVDGMQIARPNPPGYRKMNATFIGKRRRSLPKTYLIK